VVVSRQRQQIERLIEDNALLDARLRELDERLAGPTTTDRRASDR
jgi:regulator of replication initiation timing